MLRPLYSDTWLTVCFVGSVSFKLSLCLWGWAEPGCQLVRILSFVNIDKFRYYSDQLKCYLRNLSFWSVNITLTAKTYTEPFLKDKSAPDDHSNSLYRVLTLMAKTYMEVLLKDKSALDGHPDSLYWVLTLMAKTYTKALLKDKSAPDDHSYSLYQVLTLTTKTNTEALMKNKSL